MTHAQRCRDAHDALSAAPALSTQEFLVGFDGFVDSIVDVVDTRQDAVNYTRIDTIKAYGERIAAVAGRSTNLERVVKQVKIGGNGPIMANAMLGHGIGLNYIGILGGDAPESVFVPMVERSKNVVDLGPACRTDAYEFDDGKIMMTLSEPLSQVTWDKLVAEVGVDRLKEYFKSANGIATVNWTQTIAMTDMWQHISAEILPGLREDRPIWFVDLADPAKRTAEDLRNALDTLKDLEQHVQVMLGMNEEEVRQVVLALGGTWNEDLPNLERAEYGAREVQRLSGFSIAVVHFVAEAACATADGSWSANGFFTPKPKITTGAGDHFNAGFVAGWLAGLKPLDCLLVGTATSGFYVREAESPTRADLLEFFSKESVASAD